MQKSIGINMLDQYIPANPLTMGSHGYEGTTPSATTGAEEIVCDGIHIDSPEAVVEHLEKFEFPRLRKQIENFDEGSKKMR